MSIVVRERVPDTTFQVVSSHGVQDLSVTEYFASRRIVLFGLPGAFTPTSDKVHLPEIMKLVAGFKAQGFDRVAVTSTNDAYVLDAWSRVSGSAGSIDFLADPNGSFAQMLGVSFNASNRGMGPVRCKRFALAAENGVVTHLCVEDNPYQTAVPSASDFLRQISERAAKAA